MYGTLTGTAYAVCFVAEIYHNILFSLCQYNCSYQLFPPLTATFIDYHVNPIMSNIIYCILVNSGRVAALDL